MTSVTQAQESQLLNYLKANNYSKFYEVYEVLPGILREEYVGKLVSILNNASLKQTIHSAKKDPDSLTPPERSGSKDIPVYYNSSISDCSSWFNTALNNLPGLTSLLPDLCKGYSFKILPDGKLVILYKEMDGTLYNSEALDPFTDYINLWFKEDFNYAGIKSGEIMTPMALYAYHVARRQEEVLNAQANRVAINTAAIIGAVATGGTSLSLLTVSAVTLSATDIVISVYEDKLNGTEWGQTSLRYYDNFNLALAAIQGGAILRNSGMLNIRFNFSKFLGKNGTKLYNDFLEKANELINHLRHGVGSYILDATYVKFKGYFTNMMLEAKLWAECKTFANGNYFNANFENLYLKTNRTNSSLHIGSLEWGDQGPAFRLQSGNINTLARESDVSRIVDDIDFEKVGELNNTAYYRDDVVHNGNLDVYQSKANPNRVILVERAGVVSNVGDILGSIMKNGNKIEYTNPAGKLLKWSEQSANDITNAINTSKNLPVEANNIGRITEAKVGEFVKAKKNLDSYGIVIKDDVGQVVAELDVTTLDEIIEVKASFSSVKEDQFARLLNSTETRFVNPYQKKVILYIDKPLSEATQGQINMINRIKEQGVTVVYSLEELGGVLK